MKQRENFIFDQLLFHALSIREAAWPSSQWTGLSKSIVSWLSQIQPLRLPPARWNFKSLLLCLIGCIFSNILVECLLKAGAAECCPMLFKNILYFYLDKIDYAQASPTPKYMYS